MSEKPLDLEDTKKPQAMDAKVGYRFGGKMSKETIDAKTASYLAKGWRIVDNPGYLMFISPCGNWFNSYNFDSGQFMSFSKEWIEKIGRINDGISKDQ